MAVEMKDHKSSHLLVKSKPADRKKRRKDSSVASTDANINIERG